MPKGLEISASGFSSKDGKFFQEEYLRLFQQRLETSGSVRQTDKEIRGLESHLSEIIIANHSSDDPWYFDEERQDQ